MAKIPDKAINRTAGPRVLPYFRLIGPPVIASVNLSADLSVIPAEPVPDSIRGNAGIQATWRYTRRASCALDAGNPCRQDGAGMTAGFVRVISIRFLRRAGVVVRRRPSAKRWITRYATAGRDNVIATT
jgi:hypothetical protein